MGPLKNNPHVRMIPESLWGHGTRKLQGDKWYWRARGDKWYRKACGDMVPGNFRKTNGTGELEGTNGIGKLVGIHKKTEAAKQALSISFYFVLHPLSAPATAAAIRE